MSSPEERIALLWTGGWDSTYQLLQLLLLQGRTVTPYYLTDPGRESTRLEIQAMRQIREHLLAEFPQAHKLLAPVQMIAVAEVPAAPAITAASSRIREKRLLGSQYDWLARFCASMELEGMQLCIHRDDRAHAALEGLVSEAADPDRSAYRVDPRFEATDEFLLFGRYHLPLFNLSKVQMAATASTRGWDAIMDLTWFCHTPTAGAQPCGRCNPCVFTIEEGLGHRVPLRGRMGYVIRRKILRPVKSAARRILGTLGLMRQQPGP